MVRVRVRARDRDRDRVRIRDRVRVRFGVRDRVRVTLPGSAFAIPMAAPRLLSPVRPPCLPSLISARFLDSALSSSAKVRCSSSCDSIDRLFCTVPHRTHTRSPWRMSMSKTALWPGGVHSGILHTTSEPGAHADLDIMNGLATSFVSSPTLVFCTDE